MRTIEVRDSARVVRRRMNKAIRRSFVKALTEPITNSDDSYRRLESAAATLGDPLAGSVKEIVIYVNRKSKRFDVVDCAEGMSLEQMSELFSEYGEKKPTQVREARSLFGQGLSDVLFSRDHGGWVRSVKNNQFGSAQFKWKTVSEDGRTRERRVINLPERPEKTTAAIHQQLKIPRGNGTNVSFHFTEVAFPQKSTIIERLANFYMLRFINSDTKRKIRVIFLDANGRVEGEEIIRYGFPQGELAAQKVGTIEVEGFSVPVKAEIFLAPDELPQAEAEEGRQGGLLVHDEFKHVLDQTLFEYEPNPYARRIFGTVELRGVSDYIRRKLDENEEVLHETRDGLVQGHELYKKLSRLVGEWLKPIVDQERQERAGEGAKVPKHIAEQQRKAFARLNELYQKIHQKTRDLGRDEGIGEHRPANGIEFDRKTTTLEAGVESRIGLRVDTRIIPPDTEIVIESETALINVDPGTFVVEDAKSHDDVDGHYITLFCAEPGVSGRVVAFNSQHRVELAVTVVETPLQVPTNGLAFDPSSATSRPGRRHRLNLLVDTSKIAPGAEVQFSSSNALVVLDAETASVPEPDGSIVSLVPVTYVGHQELAKAIVVARVGEYVAEASIRIRTIEGEKGMFKDWRYKALPSPEEAFFDADTGYVEINSNHPVNRRYFGETEQEAIDRVAKLPHCQILLAGLVLDEALFFTYAKAYQENKVSQRTPEAPWIDIRRYITEAKRELGPAIYDAFVSIKVTAQEEEVHVSS